MGRKWLYKVTGAGDGGKLPSPVTGKKEKYKNSSSSGCMSAIYSLFDVQHHQFRIHHPSLMSSESAIIDDNKLHSSFSLQGIEAPRNSLELPQSTMEITHSTSKVKEQTNLNIQVGRMQIKTNRSKFIDDLSSECCISPGTKTPNLVARLMGLDLLPEYSSPRASASSVTTNSHHHSRSLPLIPRLSTASRRSTDNEYHHRLSLQIDKENCSGQESRRQLEPKKVTNLTRERISRRLGTDITNTMSPTRGKCPRRDANLVLLKPRKSLAMETMRKAKRDESVSLSRSQKIRLLDIKINLSKPISNSPKSQTPKKLRQTRLMKLENFVKDEKIKRIASERYDLRLKKMGQQQKSTALPNQVVNVNNVKKFQSFKKEMTSCSSTTTLSQKQVSLPSNLNPSYNSNDTHNLKAAVTTTTTAVAATTTAPGAATCSFKIQQSTAAAATTTAADWEVFEWDMRRLLLEVEDMVVEIESDILGNLVHEIVTVTMAPAASDMVRSHVPFT